MSSVCKKAKNGECPDGISSPLWCTYCSALPSVKPPIETKVEPDPAILKLLEEEEAIEKNARAATSARGKVITETVKSKTNISIALAALESLPRKPVVQKCFNAKFTSNCYGCGEHVEQGDLISAVLIPGQSTPSKTKFVCAKCALAYHADWLLLQANSNPVSFHHVRIMDDTTHERVHMYSHVSGEWKSVGTVPVAAHVLLRPVNTYGD